MAGEERCPLCVVDSSQSIPYFATKKALQQHMQSCHPQQAYFQCAECSVSFTLEHNWKRHVRSKHPHTPSITTLDTHDGVATIAKVENPIAPGIPPPSEKIPMPAAPSLRDSSAMVDPSPALSDPTQSSPPPVVSRKRERPSSQPSLDPASDSTLRPLPVVDKRYVGKRWAAWDQYKRDLSCYTQDWNAWSQAYELLRGTDEAGLSAGYALEVQRVVKQCLHALGGLITSEQPFPWNCWETLEDWLQCWDTQELTMFTQGDYFRKLHWHALYLYCRDESTFEVVEELYDTSAQWMKQGTRDREARLCLSMQKPDQLIDLRNQIVIALNQRAVEYDAFIATFLRERPPRFEKQLVAFGLKLRCFIDLVIRYTGIPLRVQATQHLHYDALKKDVVPGSGAVQRQVCHLLLRSDGRYYRLVDYDKVGQSQKPLPLPLDDVVCTYLYFYLTYCRPTGQDYGGWVFVGEKGGRWHTVSADLLEYLHTDLGVSTQQYTARGFIHGSRTVSLACYAALVHFSVDKLQRFAILMRHSFETMNRFYSTWSHWYSARQSHQEFIEATQQESRYSDHLIAPPPVLLVPMRQPSAMVFEVLKRERFREAGCQPLLAFAVQSVGTQTGETGLESSGIRSIQGSSEELHDPLSPLPYCVRCNQVWSLMGPIQDKRSPQTGRFWCACRECGPESGTKWLPVGFTPTYETYQRMPKRAKMEAVK